MMLRKLILFAGLPLFMVSTGGYVAWPAFSMYQIEQAIKAGDETMLEAKVNWDSTRRSFAESTKKVADHEIKKRSEKMASKGESTVLLSVASLMSPAIIDQVVESYANPKGLIELSRNGWKIDVQKLAPKNAVKISGADEKTNKKVNDTIGKVSNFMKYYKEFDDAKKQVKQEQQQMQPQGQNWQTQADPSQMDTSQAAPSQAEKKQPSQGSVADMGNSGSSRHVQSANSQKEQAVHDEPVQIQDSQTQDVQIQDGQIQDGKVHVKPRGKKIGYENLRFFGVMGFTGFREITIGVSQNPEKERPDIIAVLRFEDFDWKIVELRPQPQM